MVFPPGPPGSSSINFKVIDDQIDEFDELLIINLIGEPSNATLDHLPDTPTQLLITMSALQLNLTEMITVMILYLQQK